MRLWQTRCTKVAPMGQLGLVCLPTALPANTNHDAATDRMTSRSEKARGTFGEKPQEGWRLPARCYPPSAWAYFQFLARIGRPLCMQPAKTTTTTTMGRWELLSARRVDQEWMGGRLLLARWPPPPSPIGNTARRVLEKLNEREGTVNRPTAQLAQTQLQLPALSAENSHTLLERAQRQRQRQQKQH